jgi:hypothetical protein
MGAHWLPKLWFGGRRTRTVFSPATEAETARAGVAKIWGGVLLVPAAELVPRGWECNRLRHCYYSKRCSEGPTMKNAAAEVSGSLDLWRRDTFGQ